MTREELIEKLDEWYTGRRYAFTFGMVGIADAEKRAKEAAALHSEILAEFERLKAKAGEADHG